jgi:hypothetical protein
VVGRAADVVLLLILLFLFAFDASFVFCAATNEV